MKWAIALRRADGSIDFWYIRHCENPHWTRDVKLATPFTVFDDAITERSDKLSLYKTVVVPIQ